MEKYNPKDTIVVRVVSAAGRSRIEVDKNATFGQLCSKIAEHLQLHPSTLQLYKDMNYKQKVFATGSAALSKSGISDGIVLFVNNKDAKIPVQTSPKIEAKKEEATKPPKPEYKKEIKQVRVETEEEKKKSLEWKKSLCTHGPHGKCLNCAEVTGEEIRRGIYEEKCDHPPSGKCPKCLNRGFIKDAKHVSFDNYLNELKAKCKDLHPPDAHCHNCLPPTQISYKLKQCKEHPPYPHGLCTKCMPPTANLARQPYRHVDYVQFMNLEEMNSFMGYWSTNLAVQRIGYLYGYYSKDPNYPDGVRAIVEAVYEPPQKGEFSGSAELPDQDRAIVDAVAEALGFTRLGWIFTSPRADVFLTSSDVLKMAKLQEENCVLHSSGARVSKFVTVKAKVISEKGETGLEASMVSDQCQALVRDGIFSGVKNDTTLQARKPKQDEVIPSIIYGKSGEVTEVPIDYFVVNLSHGAPIDKQGFNTLQYFDFPRENRPNKPQVRGDIKSYFTRHNKKDGKSYLDFHLLVYLAKVLDIESVMSVVHTSLNNMPPLEGIVDLIDSIPIK